MGDRKPQRLMKVPFEPDSIRYDASIVPVGTIVRQFLPVKLSSVVTISESV
ncbi:MAG: hypothetical protein JWO05_17 [Gemmatimonadetes bacterium]|nr:hypothetical protein [Gemmatimonadota bacterium]